MKLDFPRNLIHFLSTTITQLWVDGFEFRFHTNLLNIYGSVSKGPDHIFVSLEDPTKPSQFVFVFAGVTTTSRHVQGLPGQNEKKGRKLVI